MKLRALCAIAMAALLCACGVKQQTLPPKEANSPHPAQEPPTVPQEPTPGSAEELLIPDPLTGASPAMNSAAFWIDLDKTADEPRMTEEERLAYRAALCEAEGTGLADLDRFAADVTGAEIRRLILLYGEAPGEGYFTGEAGDEPLGPETRREIRENTALEAVPDRALPRYGFAVRSAILRAWPSALPLYRTAGDTRIDRGAETRVKLWTPLVALHTSADGGWIFARAEDYAGWLPAEAVACCAKEEWDELRLRLEEDFVLVTAARLIAEGEHTLYMAEKLPLEEEKETGFTVLFPESENGDLALRPMTLRKGEGLHRGYLPFTGRSLLEQAFRLLGEPYGWGGTKDGWDCSALCQDCYLTVGVMLPRNSGAQARIPGALPLEDLTAEERLRLLERAGPGALLTLPGHQTLYLGSCKGEAFVIQATLGVYAPDGSGAYDPAEAVIVTSTLARRDNGRTILDNAHTLVPVGHLAP